VNILAIYPGLGVYEKVYRGKNRNRFTKMTEITKGEKSMGRSDSSVDPFPWVLCLAVRFHVNCCISRNIPDIQFQFSFSSCVHFFLLIVFSDLPRKFSSSLKHVRT
jgi:hypothetical protein